MEAIKTQFLEEIETMFWFNLTNNEKNVEFDFWQYKLNRLYKPLIKTYAKQFFDSLGTDIENNKEKQKVIDIFIDFFSLYYYNWDFGYFKSKFNNYQYRVNYSWKDTEFFWATKDCYYVKTNDVVNEIELNAINSQIWLDIWENKEDLKLKFSKKVKSSSEDKEKYDFSIEFNELKNWEENLIGYEIIFYNWEESKPTKATKLKQIKEELKEKGIDYDKNTWLQNALDNFLKKWWRDYFIHKRLKEFLNEELEWYFFQVLKNDIQNKVEILELQNKINSLKEKYSDDKEYLDFQVAKLLKENNSDDKNLNIYTFSYAWILNFINILSDLEELKKSLWLKKRKVVREDFCITLWRLDEIIRIDREQIFNEIATNEKQLEEWKELLNKDLKHIKDINLDIILSEIKNLSFDKAKNIVVDSKHFDRNSEVYKRFVWMWKMELYEDNTNLDWILVKSENFQALNTLQDKYVWKIKTTYIDPPYNTWSDGFLYKDWFSHSTWCSMMNDRLTLWKKFLDDENGWLFAFIDENSKYDLKMILDLNYIFKQDFIWNYKTIKNMPWNIVKRQYDDIFMYSINWDYSTNYLFEDYWLKYFLNFFKEYIDDDNLELNATSWYTSIYTNDFLEKYKDKIKSTQSYIKDLHTQFKAKNKVWDKFIEEYETFLWDKIKEKRNFFRRRDNYIQPLFANWVMKWKRLNAIIDEQTIVERRDEEVLLPNWQKPQRLMKKLFDITIHNNKDLILDYFMWSATTQATAHKMWRKYIWVELWSYFETIDLPRMKRVLEWEEGWISKDIDWKWTKYQWWWFFKYLYLNQYEDWFSDNGYLKDLESDINSLENLKVDENKISDLLVRLKDIKEKIYNADENL